jgi:hypothetical protein
MTLLLDVTKARSYFLHSAAGSHSLAWISVAVAALKLVLLILGELQKRYELKGVSTGPEATRRFWGRIIFAWLNSTLLLGFRTFSHLKTCQIWIRASLRHGSLRNLSQYGRKVRNTPLYNLPFRPFSASANDVAAQATRLPRTDCSRQRFQRKSGLSLPWCHRACCTSGSRLQNPFFCDVFYNKSQETEIQTP